MPDLVEMLDGRKLDIRIKMKQSSLQDVCFVGATGFSFGPLEGCVVMIDSVDVEDDTGRFPVPDIKTIPAEDIDEITIKVK